VAGVILHLKAHKYLKEMSFSKSPSGPGFQVFFEFKRFIFSSKSDISYERNWSFVLSVMNFMAVVFHNSSGNISCTTNVG